MRPRRAGDSGCAVVAGTCRQLPAFVVLCDHAFAHRCVRSCWQASRDRRRREGHPFSPLKLIGCLERRLKPTLQILQWECGSAALQPFPGVQSAKALYKSNRVAATTRAVCGKQCLAAAPFSSTLRRRRLRRLRRLGRHSFRRHCRTPPPPPAVAPLVPSSCQPPQHRRPLTKPLHPAPTRAAQSVATALLPVLLRHFWSVVALCFVVELALGL